MSPVTVTDLNNAKLDCDTIGAAATSSAPTVTDRLGNTKNTLSGMNAAVLASAAAVQGSIGYLPPVAYAAGISLTLAAQTVGYAGQTYAPILSALPFTTSGTFETAKFRLIQGVSGADLAAVNGSALSGHLPAGVGAVSTTVQTQLRERKSLLNFMSDALKSVTTASAAYTVQNRADMLTAVEKAWASALLGGHDLYAPAGRYELGENSFPWRQQVVSGLLDCKNVTLYCDGPATVFATVSVNGADVFQLNGLENFHVKGFPTLTGTVSGSAAGTNGVSITNGWDNLTLEVACLNLPSLDKTSYVDGGKALTLQPGTTANRCGSLVAVVHAKGCAEGFGIELDLSTAATKKTAVDVEVLAEDCFFAAKISALEATGALSAGITQGVKVRGVAINCQKDVVASRAHGVDIDIKVVTTKTAAARRVNPAGVAWFAAGAVVEALLCTYAKNSRIVITGSKGECDYKARIGGINAGASGLNGRTEHCDIYLDIGGTAATLDIAAVDSGGNTMSFCDLFVTSTTAVTLPAVFYTAAQANTLSIGQAKRLVSPTFAGDVSFSQSATGTVPTGKISLLGSVTVLQGLASSSANALVIGMYDQTGLVGIGVKNSGRPWLPSTVPVRADNAAMLASGYEPGDVYRTTVGALMVVY